MAMCSFCGMRILYKNINFALLIFIAIFPIASLSHRKENPSLKYSREVNENFMSNSYDYKYDRVEVPGHMYDQQAAYGHEYLKKQSLKKTDLSEVWLFSMISTLFISAAPFMLLIIIPIDNSIEMRPRLKVLLAFASGGLLGDAFLHLIPHAVNPHYNSDNSNEHIHHSHGNSHFHSHNHDENIVIGLFVLAGIITFLTVEKLVRYLKGETNFDHGHSPNEEKIYELAKRRFGDKPNQKSVKISKNKKNTFEISGYLNLAADFAHNFTDGLAIGASYLAGKNIGLVTTITIVLHEVPHEIGDFAILIKSGCSRRKAMFLQLLTALGALTGNLLAVIGVGGNSNASSWVLPFTAGGFTYIATVSVLPELLQESTKLVQSIKEITALLTGVILMAFIAIFE